MPAATEKKDPAAPFASRVDEQLAQATSRIRAHDLAFGGLLLVALLLAYTTAMVVLDKSFVLPEWARQVALAGFLVGLAAAAYFGLVRPLRLRINPLYAARQVERTIDDSKNSVTGYVDAQEKGDLNPTVKAALASRAAKTAAEADVNRAVDHRSLLYLGGVAVALLLTLIVLFFVFRPAQFASLVTRAFNPFARTEIGTRTQLQLVKPDPADATITAGQSVTVAVHVGGKVPAADGPERVRLLVRHNPNDPNYDEVPMVPGETSRDFEVRVPDYLVQNGFWYKVAGGDDATAEHRVTVRSLPTFTEFRTTYEYPKYLRLKPDTSNDPILRAYRGTKVTLVAKANREVRDGLMVVEPGNARIAGTPVAGQPGSLQFVIPKLAESGRYKLTFTATNGETTPDAFTAAIRVEADLPPRVVINKPEEEETQVPANGQVAIDGNLGDDFGIDTVTLKMKVVEPVQRPLPDVPYLNGKSPSFRRAKDGTFPTDLVYKGSVDLAKLKKDAAGLPLELGPDMVIELWLEATDNCTEPKPNVGRSAAKRVRLTPPKTEEMAKEQLQKQKQERKDEEQKHNDQQKQKLDQEKRDPNQKPGEQKKNDQQLQDKQPDAKNEQSNTGDKQPNEKQPAGKDGMGEKQPDAKEPQPKEGEPNNQPAPKDGNNPPQKKEGAPNGMGEGADTNPNSEPNPRPNEKNEKGGKNNQAQQDIENTAKDFEKQIQQENKNGGSGKSNPTPKQEERADPGQAKPQPKDGGMGEKGMNNAAETKPEPNPNDPKNPKGGEKDNAPAQSKPEGQLEKPQDPATAKPEPKQGNGGTGAKNAAPAEKRDEPFGAPPGTDKEPPKQDQPAPKDPSQKQDPASGSTAKPSTEKQPEGGEPAGTPNAEKKQDPAAKAGTGAKPPMRDPSRGEDKPSEQPKEQPGTGGAGKKPDAEPKAGDAKPEKAPPAGDAKPKPPGDTGTEKGAPSEPKPEPASNDPMKPNGTGAAEAKPDQQPNAPKAGEKSVAKGTDKPQPQGGGEKGKPGAGDNSAQKKPDPEQMKKLEEAAKNLNSPDAKKREDARKTLDNAVGEQNRKELEQLQKDLNSPDKDRQAAAQKKLNDLKRQMQNGSGKGEDKKDAPKFDEKQQKEIADAMKDLQSGDKDRQQQAREKLDKTVGEQNRKDAEQLMNDLKSDDKAKREAAQKKIEEMKKEMDRRAGKDKKDGKPDTGKPKGKEPSPEEVAELAKKAQDLNSPDEEKRKQAEKELDDKIGRENREKLQEEMKNKKPDPKKQADDLKQKMDEWRQGPGGGPRNKGPMEDDKKNRLKAAELNLDHFESEQYRKKLQGSKGWTDEEYERFLDGYKQYVENLRKGAAAADKPAAAPTPGEPGRALGVGGGGKVEATGAPGSGTTTVGGPTAAPPGFENARDKFEKALKKKP